MSKSFIYNLILTIVAIVVFIFIGASVYDAFTRNPVNRGLEGTTANTVSGQIEAATPTATQPGQATPANNAAGDSTSNGADAAPTSQDKKQADAAYDQTNDPTRSAPPAEQTRSGSPDANEPAAASSARPDEATAPKTTPAPTTSPARTAPAPRPESAPSPSTSIDPAAPTGASPPAARSNPDLRSVIPPVPTAPPRAEGTRPPVTTDQDMYNATDSGQNDGNVSDNFPAPVSNFPAPVGSATPDSSNTIPPMGAAPSRPSPEQQRLEELRRQKEQLRRDMGF